MSEVQNSLGYDPQEELDRIKLIKSLFENEGWVKFLEDMANNKKSVDNVSNIEGAQQLGIRQGQTLILNGILNYEQLILATEEQINADIEALKTEQQEQGVNA